MLPQARRELQVEVQQTQTQAQQQGRQHRHEAKPSSSSSSKRRWRRRIIHVALLLLVLVVCWLGFRQSNDVTDPTVRDRIRKEWEREVEEHRREMAKLNEDVRGLREDLGRERQRWAEERQKHKEEEAEWQRRIDDIQRKEREWKQREEEEERRKRTLHWDEVKPDEHCLQYKTRRYSASLWVPNGLDGHKYCLTTPIEILGVNYTGPLWCEEVERGRWRGHWDVPSSPDCATFFETYHDKGCTAPGSGLYRYEAHLGNLRQGDDGNIMCSTTPTDLMGHEYSSPHHCADWGKHGFWGIWFVEDSQC
ncbi:hypothetical protein AX16_007815 [Volvariella volvacea WC 439]|nr:hypothetical protein AX16_007815 [Volvariella volvacea WC 439]